MVYGAEFLSTPNWTVSQQEREICAERAQVACSYFLREKGEYGRKLLNIKRTRRGTMESYSSVGMILEAEWKFHCYRE
ncbi:hypothetical protein T4D_1846 [Trichinella pseudospiralis]|uniref:Uncharacterized protein n=1 Tax=Trichinella pseudospiralis TaxID=6337 RepID=A0A0V1F3L2_TRIPS|nr:hypothetical protein T4D_1846 [Trichinella pseudospiralis]